MTARLAALGLALALAGCGNDPAAPTPVLRTLNFNGSLQDPTGCTCGDGINQYTVQPGASGRLDAVATFQPADAQIVVRLLDESFNTVFAVSTRSGTSARLSHDVAPGTYRLQVFLASSGPRQATFGLTVTHP
jgi:hypothetical protein